MRGIQKDSKVLKPYQNQVSKPLRKSRISTFEYKEYSKQKAFRSSLYISKLIGIKLKSLHKHYKLVKLCLQSPKNFHYKSSKTKNIHPNHSSKSQSSTGIKFRSLQKLQRLWSIEVLSDSSSKAPKNFHHKSLKINKIRRTHEEQ